MSFLIYQNTERKQKRKYMKHVHPLAYMVEVSIPTITQPPACLALFHSAPLLSIFLAASKGCWEVLMGSSPWPFTLYLSARLPPSRRNRGAYHTRAAIRRLDSSATEAEEWV